MLNIVTATTNRCDVLKAPNIYTMSYLLRWQPCGTGHVEGRRDVLWERRDVMKTCRLRGEVFGVEEHFDDDTGHQNTEYNDNGHKSTPQDL